MQTRYQLTAISDPIFFQRPDAAWDIIHKLFPPQNAHILYVMGSLTGESILHKKTISILQTKNFLFNFFISPMLSSAGVFSFFAFFDLITPVCKFISSCWLALTPASCLANSFFAPASRHRPEIDALGPPNESDTDVFFEIRWDMLFPVAKLLKIRWNSQSDCLPPPPSTLCKA